MKLFCLLSLALIFSALTGCKRDGVNPDKDKASNTSPLVAKWGLAKDSLTFSSLNGVVHIQSYEGKADDYYDFRADGKCYIRENAVYDTISYKMTAEKSVIFGDPWSYVDTGTGKTVTVEGYPSTIDPLTAHNAKISFSLPASPGGGGNSKTVYLVK